MAKMSNIELNEVSLVDYPAHQVEGFAVIKSADPAKDRALRSALRKETMPENKLADVLKGLSADDIRAALSEEQLAELAPAPVTKAEEEVEPTEDDIFKSLPESVRERITKAEEKAAELEAEKTAAIEKANAEREERENSEAIQKSKDTYTNLSFEHEKVAPALRKFAAADAEAAEVINTMLAAVNAQADGAIFKELGTGHDGDTSGETAYAKLERIAKATAEAESIPFAVALNKTVADPANEAIVAEHFNTQEKN